ncbi:3-oxoacyl-[acyl-carrier protein] reductase [Kosakonia arachidis]|uniref:3-oxoacyl-[acyl-carrier protein] reductase n=1 Tax=Kosakonia arachidis TaxID=551989 RepID=A0A1I7DV24_9ENTR|nr:3-oxoacyl-ACP reductase FabG [Kosakonia arachidis]SFU15519.1 3-oxoacyl-[acyl-carrier protein] reductase [Kosakonia arachidis]
MYQDLKGKTILITGGSSGIGLGLALHFARNGSNVAITARNADKLATAISIACTEGLTIKGYVCDVSVAQQVKETVAICAEQLGGLDVLCCNAGIFPSAALSDMTESEWDDVHAVNSKGTFLCVQSAIPWLKQANHGRIILTSSITGPVTGYPGWAHYAASKASQLGFMRTAALELAKDNITVNAILPGNIITEGLAGMGDDYIAAMAQSVPLQRLGSVDDIAAAALFFASQAAGYITGQTLIVDGGQILPESSSCIS